MLTGRIKPDDEGWGRGERLLSMLVGTMLGVGMASNASGKSFRLPTQAEWEFANEVGNKSKNHEFSGSNNIDSVDGIVKIQIKLLILLGKNHLVRYL